MSKKKYDMSIRTIDCHMHCGVQNSKQPIEKILPLLKDSQCEGACLYAPVEDIYNRYDYDFVDDPKWITCRKKANDYLEKVSKDTKKVNIYPYFFVWNDFDVKFGESFKGIKWHRHSVTFLKRVNAQTVVIIPHLGMLNGGYDKLKKAGVWKMKNVWADTALASGWEIEDYVKNYGSDTLMYGSDWPFGDPVREKKKVLKCSSLTKKDKEKIMYHNIAKLLKKKE